MERRERKGVFRKTFRMEARVSADPGRRSEREREEAGKRLGSDGE